MSKAKKPEVRKMEIIQAALELFAQDGYENTSVNHIIERAGVSKGGFYHHYDSKAQLLEDIARLFLDKIAERIQGIAEMEDLSALEKTNEYFRQVNSYKEQRAAEVSTILAGMYSGGKNIQLEHAIFQYGSKRIAPLMTEIIRQGIEEGEFGTEFPEEAAEMFVRLFVINQNQMSELFFQALQQEKREEAEKIVDVIKRKYQFFQQLLEDTLGLEKGSLVLQEVAEETVNYLLKALDAR